MQWFTRLPEPLRQKPVAAVARATGKAILIIVLPFILLSGLNQYFAENDINQRIAAERQEMTRILGDVAAEAEPLKRFNKAFTPLAALPFPSEAFDRRLKQNFGANPGSVEVFLYDQQGNCLTLPFMPVPPRFVAQKFLEAAIDPAKGKKYERFIFQFSGYRSAHVVLNSTPDKLVSIGASHDRHWGGWFRLKDGDGNFSGHLIVFIGKRLLVPDQLLEEAIVSAAGKFGRNYHFGWQDPIDKTVVRPDSPGFSASATAAVNAMAIGESNFMFSGCPGIKHYTDAGTAIVARTVYALEPSMLYRGLDFTIRLVAFLAFLLIAYLLLGISSVTPGLRFRLAALFLYGAGIPLILLIFTGIADRSEREKVLIDGLQQQSIAELTRIDEGLTYEYRRLEGIFKTAIKKSTAAPPDKFRASLEEIGRLITTFSESLREILIVTDSYNFSFTRGKPLGKGNTRKESLVHYGEMLLETIRGEFVEKHDKPATTDVKSVISDFGGWLARGLIMGSGRIGMLNMLDSILPTYIDVFIDKTNRARAMMYVFLSQAGLQRNYLLQVSRLRDRLTGEDVARFAALPIDATLYWPSFPKRSTGDETSLRQLADQVVRSGLPAHQVAMVGRGQYLLSAIRGNHLDGYILVLAQPYHIVENNIDKLNQRMIILSVLVILLALVSAKIASTLLLRPLENLTTGLNAVSNGNFRVQVEGAAVEDFSMMLSSLNRTLTGFQEMQVARTVQETLWPEKALHGEDWQLYGRCITATELGGDHYDWFALRDGRVLLVVGDVTGHGIAPAMVQASTKVWLSLLAENAKSAAELLQKINRLHFKYGAKRLYMTCWLAFYSPSDGQLDFACAGHPYPVILRDNQEPELLDFPGMPLGVRAKPTIGCGKRVLSAGDKLVLYTDGLIEATSIDGQMLGFEGFVKLCQQAARLEPAEIIDYLIDSANAWGPQNDDQTVIVLKRYHSGDNDAGN